MKQPHVHDDQSGCGMMLKLWKVALECNIDDPGITGTTGRVNNFVKCDNLQKFYNVATQKCWEERSRNIQSVEFPPVIHIEEKKSTSSSSSNSGNAHK